MSVGGEQVAMFGCRTFYNWCSPDAPAGQATFTCGEGRLCPKCGGPPWPDEEARAKSVAKRRGSVSVGQDGSGWRLTVWDDDNRRSIATEHSSTRPTPADKDYLVRKYLGADAVRT